MAAAIDRCIRLRYEIVLFTISGQIVDLICYPAVRHLAIWCLDKTKLINAREGAHRADQTNVRAFRRFDRTDTAVVRWVNVAYFKPGTFAAETSRSQSGQTALVCQFCKRIRLIHELRKLRSAKEIPDDRAERLGIDQLLWRHPVHID